MKNKYDYILNLFVSTNELRPAMRNPGEIDNFVYAADGYTCVCVPKKYIDTDYKNEEYPRANTLFEDIDFTDVYAKFTTESLINVLALFKFRYKMLPCSKCDGEGTIHCDCCENENNCKDCGGTGDSNKIHPLLIKLADYGDFIKIKDKFFYAHFIDRVLQVALITRAEVVRLFNRNENCFFKIDNDIVILVMPYKVSDDSMIDAKIIGTN